MKEAAPVILLVEDDELNRDMLYRRLTRKNYDVEVAANGLEGVNKAVELKPDIVLMDMRMPEMDGIEATRVIRKTASIQHLPVIALSGDIMESDRDKALAAGCNDYDTKPVDLARLVKKITALL